MRVDRAQSPLGKPYVMRSEADREAVCSAYADLLGRPTIVGEDMEMWHGSGGWWMHGFDGEVRGWRATEARTELERLRRIAPVKPYTVLG